MKTPKHMMLGAAVGAAPDVMLLAYGWRKKWIAETHPLVRVHRFLHTPTATALVAGIAYASHLWADKHSSHRTEATRKGRIR